jgi:ABC-type phosphate transport system permease subunit
VVHKGGWILVFYRTKGLEHVTARDFRLISEAMPAFRAEGLSYFTSDVWDPAHAKFGTLAMLAAMRGRASSRVS